MQIRGEVKQEVNPESYQQYTHYQPEDVKLQFSPELYPPAVWHPLPPTTKSWNGPNQPVLKTQHSQLTQFIQLQRACLLRVLSQGERERFIVSYENIKSRRFYILIVVAFAKWCSNRLSTFLGFLYDSLKSQQLYPSPEGDSDDIICQALAATQLYLEGKLEKAVYQLYKGCKEFPLSSIVEFMRNIESSFEHPSPGPSDDSVNSSQEESERQGGGESSESELISQASEQKGRELRKESSRFLQGYPFVISQRKGGEVRAVPLPAAELKLKCSWREVIKK